MRWANMFALATSAAALLLGWPATAPAANISMPPGSRSWIYLESSQCQDGTGDDCTGGVTSISGSYGFQSAISVNASLNANQMNMLLAQTNTSGYAFLYSSMIDTYTLHSSNLPDGTPVTVTVNFHVTGSLNPLPWPIGGVFGGGDVMARIGTTFDGTAGFPPAASAQQQLSAIAPLPTGTPIPIDLTPNWTFTAAIGTPFDLSYEVAPNVTDASIDLSHTAAISFVLPSGVTITSTGGYGTITPAPAKTWGRLRQIYR